MKKTTPISIKIILVLFCLFFIGNTYSQNKKTTNKTLFGKPVKTENVNPNNGKIRCATTEYEKFLQEKNPKRMTDAQFEAWLAPLVKKHKAMRTTSQIGGIITIPVVVHVIHSGEAIGTAPNITDAQIQSQITVLNEDFRKMAGTPGDNINPIGADTQIQFALALQDPNGNPTNGIDRVNFCQASWSNEDIDLTVKPTTIWDPTQYMNMWSVTFSNGVDLGYAQFPDGSGLGGLPASGGNTNSDGVVSSYDVFGSINYNDGSFILAAPYNKGRTMSHEVGHWLGLRHIWGDSACGDDFCADTPVHHDSNFGCPTVVDCNAIGNEMVENYMDYTDDACMNIFTLNQKDRITTIINNAARRMELKTSTKNSAITLFPNDAEVKIEANHCLINAECIPPPPTNKQVAIFNRGTTTLTSVTLNYTINGGSNQTFNWTGSLAQHQSATVILPNTNSYGTLNVSIASTNGGADQRPSNDSASASFIAPSIPNNFNFNTFKFTLQQDYFGSETTWDLKNASGTILYSGGPYLDTYVDDTTISPIPDLIVENWTLTNNQCYTFTIYDTAGDGICCGTGLGGTGDGYYNITSTDGSIVITSGSTFGGSQSKSYTTNTLGTTAFEASNDIYLYPNPTKGTLNVRVPNSFGLPNSLTISNNLGQIVSRKEVSNENDLIVNTSALSNGVYFITVVKEDQKKTLRFIKE